MNVKLPSVLLAAAFPFDHRTRGSRPTGDQKGTTLQASCPVTIGRKSDIAPVDFFGSGSAHWNNNLYLGGLWPDGTIVFRPNGRGYVYQDGSVGMKIAWYRGKGVRGQLKIQGKRLDAVAPPLRAHFSDYGDTGFQPSELVFPTEGCWQVTGTVGEASVTFVVKLAGFKANVAPPAGP